MENQSIEQFEKVLRRKSYKKIKKEGQLYNERAMQIAAKKIGSEARNLNIHQHIGYPYIIIKDYYEQQERQWEAI